MDFVTYEIAKKLKEKGFREKCFATYLNIQDFGKCYNCYKDSNLDAPTIPQVLKWLREEKKIYISVEVEHEDWFEYKIVQLIKNTRCTSSHVYETYNDAMLAGIKYILDNNLI
jgi:hypothetical protein